MTLNINAGTVLDEKYRILSRLGEGAFGEVYLAEDILLKNRHVAIKSLKLADPDRDQYLIREMEFLSRLNHPNVVSFYHYFREHDSLFLVMEFCSGGSLWQVIRQNDQLDTEQAISWAIKLCQALQIVHKKGVVHHDLKPENILFDEMGTLKIGDFGVANTRMGTIPYMAPEQLLPTENVSRRDRRVDVYGLGIVVLELLTRESPFLGLSDEEILENKLRPDFISGSLPSWLREVLLRALNPQPELRFQTMQEFQEALESRHVSYVFKRKRIQAHNAGLKAEWHLNRRKWSNALKLTDQALYADPNCLNALITAGKCQLFLRRIEKALECFEQALRINPRVNIQKELACIYIEEHRYPEAISMLNDHLQRNAADYEAYNLLIKAFYHTGRYEAASELVYTILEDYRGNKCFENNLLLCELLLGRSSEELLDGIDTKNPFVEYNWKVFEEGPLLWDIDGQVPLESKLLFQEFRHGDLRKWKRNILVIENNEGDKWRTNRHIISIGRNDGNDIVFDDQGVSRRHCVIVNHKSDVWLYDMGSTQGVYCDGKLVDNSVFLEGRHEIAIPGSTFTVVAEEGLLL